MDQTKTQTLTEFLLARIAEREAVARDAAGWDLSGRERANGRWQRTGISSVEDDQRRSVIYSDNDQVSGTVADHIALNDPVRVLAECEAKRRIVELHGGTATHNCPSAPDVQDWFFIACPTLRALAAVYSDHADYRQEWRP